jgi:phenylacetate-CoA ligase
MSASVEHVYSLLRGWEVFKHLRQLKRTQWLSREDIRELQLKKLRAIVRHAYNNVPFYHSRFKEAGTRPEDIRSLEDIQKLPITAKHKLREQTPDKTIANNYDVNTLVKGSTSGTTGEPFVYYKDSRAVSHELAALCRFRSWYGFFQFKQTLLRILPYYAPWSNEFKSFLAGWLIGDGSTITLHKYIHWVREFKPRSLEGSPIVFYALDEFLRKRGVAKLSLPVALCTSETLFESYKRKIESAFNCKVFNHYGSNTICAIAQECEEHTGLHLNAEDRIVEFLKGGEVVSAGEAGEMVITDLENYAMPFIRYNIEDVGIPTDDMCSCGRGLPLINRILGRTVDLLISSEGTLVPSEIIAQFMLFKNPKWTQQIQAVQPSRHELLIRIVRSDDQSEDLKLIREMIQESLGNMQVKTEFVDAIEAPPSGKHRFVISEESQRFFSQTST